MKPIQVNTLDELHQEKLKLREQIKQQEIVLKEHYTTLSEQIKPALRILGMVTGNKLFKSITGSNDGNKLGWLETALKVVTAISAGGFILQRSKKNLLKTLLAYAIDQGVKYVQEKDLTEHFEKIKQWLSKNDEETVPEEKVETI